MRISVEKGRMFGVSWPWVRFALTNTDIVTTLNHAPLILTKASQNEFRGKIYGVKVLIEIVQDAKPDPQDEIHAIADICMPCGLGKTHTIAHYRYVATNALTTMVDLQFSFETSGPAMAIYSLFLRRNIEEYLSRVMSDNERGAVLLQDNDMSLKEMLTSEQIMRIESFRQAWGQVPAVIDRTNDSTSETSNPHQSQELQAWQPELTELTSLYERVQGKATLIEQELIRIHETRDAVATLLVARRMLEVIITQICEEKINRARGSEPLASILNKIGHLQIIPEYVVTSMENLNRLSTYGAHPKDFSPRQVREALLALCSIMEWYVSAGMKCNDNKAPQS